MTTILVPVGLYILAITITNLIGPQASAENQNVNNVNITSTDTNALYSLTVGEKAYPILLFYEEVASTVCRLMEIRRSC
jgi:hypothetical protein